MSDGDACSSACGWCGRCTNGQRPNCRCPQCGDEFWKGRDDVGDLCDACCAERDAVQDALRRARRIETGIFHGKAS
jgi:hypothetical protein